MKLDAEWYSLILEAKRIGLNIKDIQKFFNQRRQSNVN
ncbi:anti-repressor SinI family protein [Heyndrickxia coagulans]|nr:anti-repressor SinI family protein [Heyndrickxia coagulans]QPG54485.1 anti-repressor SinI family protein [Heyndrickxia coagulans]WNE62560.1 anti-repressor SinI family protein [Heyndrickxia coagulans]